jgi:hypothetical protein
MLYAVAFFAGVITGVALVRYGMSLGTKLYIQSKDDIPLDDKPKPIDQEFTH